MKVRPLRGTRDFYPENKRLLNYFFEVWRTVAEKFGYEDFDGPLLEPAQLWTLKSGAEIPEQMYVFEDKSGKKVAIRPELTPTLARMVAARQKQLVKPIKWYSIPRCWRYEAPQSGRLREFFQFNLDCLGTESMMADAEVIATAVEIMKKFGCTEKDFYIRLSNRRLAESLMLQAGVKKSSLKEVCRIIDKKDKVKPEEFMEMLNDVAGKSAEALLDMLNNKSIDSIDYNSLPEEGKKGFDELKELLKCLDDFGISSFIKVDFSIMRGFDYYTSTVFEVFDSSREFRAIAGGGRYEDLVKDFGGEPCPGVGYGMGDVVLELFLRKLGKLPELKKELDYFVAPVNKEVVSDAIKVAVKLREKYNAEVDLMGRSLRKQLDYANAVNAKRVVIAGKKDLSKGGVTVRDMSSGKEEFVKLEDL